MAKSRDRRRHRRRRICRRLGAELRAGCSKLEVEVGIWRGNEREDRICKYYVGRELRMKSMNFLTMCTKLDLHRDWMREDGDLEELNKDEKSDKF